MAAVGAPPEGGPPPFTKNGTRCICVTSACLLLVLLNLIGFEGTGRITTTPFGDSSKSVVAKGGKKNETAHATSGGLLFPQAPQKTRTDITQEGEKEVTISAIDSPPVSAPDADGDTDKSSISFMENERPKNLHIAFLGASVTRYQYMTLVYYLQYGRMLTETDRPSPLTREERSATHIDYSNIILRPNEECDCYRVTEWLPLTFADNRYYIDPQRNNSVTFLLKYGRSPAQGHWYPDQVHQPHNLSFVPEPYVWEGNWSVAIRHLSQLKPKPKYLIFTAGHHPHDLNSLETRQEIRQTLDETGIIGIYKFTTYKNGAYLPRMVRGGHEPLMCELMENRCINYKWTQNLTGADYLDHVHMRAEPNKRMNEEMLDFLQILEKGSTGSSSA